MESQIMSSTIALGARWGDTTNSSAGLMFAGLGAAAWARRSAAAVCSERVGNEDRVAITCCNVA